MKLLRTIRLDGSDEFVFDRAARPGEWAIPGAFVFADDDVRQLMGRRKQAFRAGFLGLGSFGWSTLAVVVEATAEEHAGAVESLAGHLVEAYGAPTIEDARQAARLELAFAAELAAHPEQTLVALHRSINDRDEISEQFRTFHKADAKKASAMPCSAGAFAIVEDGGEGVAADEASDISLADLLSGKQVAP